MDILFIVLIIFTCLGVIAALTFLTLLIIASIKKNHKLKKISLISGSISLGVTLLLLFFTIMTGHHIAETHYSDNTEQTYSNSDDDYSADFEITQGVESDGEVDLDSDKFFDITGTAPSDIKKVALVYNNTIVNSIPVEDGKWHIKANGDGGPYDMKFVGSTNENLAIGDDPNTLSGHYEISVHVPE